MRLENRLGRYIEKNDKTDIIFDLDGTLFRLNIPWERWDFGIRETLIKIDSSIYETYSAGNISLSELENRYTSTFGATLKKILIDHRRTFEATYRGISTPNQDLLRFLNKSHNYRKNYIWSSNTRSTIENVLEQYGISELFDTIVSGDDVNLLKPEPEGFFSLYTPDRAKEKYLMIGDSPLDMRAAENAGIDFFVTEHWGI